MSAVQDKKNPLRIYDENKRYLGPEGQGKLNKYIPTSPPGLCPYKQELIRKAWNFHAFNHDVDYAGYVSYFMYWWNSDIHRPEREKADTRFLQGMKHANETLYKRNQITLAEKEYADAWAYTFYKAVEKAGWIFYKKDKS